MTSEGRPVPVVDEPSRPFFKGARSGRLMINRCTRCRTWLAPGSRVCSECWSEDLEWARASGHATLFTFAIVHQRYHPAFAEKLPYNIAEVELEEGPRIRANILSVPNDELQIGMKLVVTFDALSEDISIPQFSPVANSGSAERQTVKA